MTKPRLYENGAYHYYREGRLIPVVCEILGDYVERVGYDNAVHISKCPGRFVRLVEVQEENRDGK